LSERLAAPLTKPRMARRRARAFLLTNARLPPRAPNAIRIPTPHRTCDQADRPLTLPGVEHSGKRESDARVLTSHQNTHTLRHRGLRQRVQRPCEPDSRCRLRSTCGDTPTGAFVPLQGNALARARLASYDRWVEARAPTLRVLYGA